MNYDTDNTLSATTREAKQLANEIRQRVFVLYYPADDEFDYSELGWGAVEAQWRCRCAQRINDLFKGSISNLPPFIWVRYHSSQLGVSQTQLNVIKVQEFQTYF